MYPTEPHSPVTVAELVAACRAGASLLVEIVGEPGSGRSRLLGALADDARRGGLHVVHGLRAAPPGGRGVVRCLDDLDRAGPETAGPLRRLLAGPPSAPTVVAYARAAGPAPQDLVWCLDAAGAAYRRNRISLGPLTREEFAARLPPGTDPVREALLYEVSCGMPGWLDMLSALTSAELRELATTDHAPGGLPLPADGPPLRELAGLAPDRIEVARCAAVLGDPFAPSLVAAVADRSTAAVLTVLDELVARGLVRAVDGATPLFRFRHPLLRTLLYARTPPGRRIAAHTRAAAALERVGAPPAQRAPHLARSAAPGDRGSARLLARAARDVLDTRPAAAATWLRAALYILPDDAHAPDDAPAHARDVADVADGTPGSPGSDERFRIEALLYHAAERTGRHAECRRLLPGLLERAVHRAPSAAGREDLLDRAVLVDLHARLECGLGRHSFARALVDAELAAPARPTARGVRLLLLRRAATAAAQGDAPTACADAERALRLAAGAPGMLEVDAAATLALAGRRASSAAPRGAGGTEAAVRTADALGDAEWADRLDAVARLGRALDLAERYGDALPLFTRALGVARRTGRVAAVPTLLLGRGHARAALGDLSAALRDAREAEETASLLGDAEGVGWAQLSRARAALWCDGPDEAADLAARVLRRHPAPGAPAATAAGVLGLARLAQGRPEEALELILRAARDADRAAPCGAGALWWSAAADAACRTGAAAAAGEYAALAADRADAEGTAEARAEALCARAGLAPDGAALPMLTAAVELSAAAGLAVLECRVRLELARRLVASGRLEEAAAEAGRVKEEADRMDARALRTAAVDAQRRIGACRPRGTSAPRGAGAFAGQELSVREEEILGMVCQGLSNREVAGALFVSVKTVEAHLTRIFRKTGARSRAALVAAFGAARTVGV
ncbi:LuxR C-terminal-related transcriptional regulator [Actinacidiphila sp. DG2A-62]|uniref:helix-turn-helix transcriptional regulator n=1 Tax=Actinacidiphila sp. DG2A-62 TaxID=3108821 RepID=UPI002DC00C14|nr:LuxR C-terminal-related transcriptional regulator [Actinacidiphila sp. DG2A-62]MEC3992709.1 LuxR C-terminal-related transcriptional regulator [Actinacidiphila sp. DG2A-62]